MNSRPTGVVAIDDVVAEAVGLGGRRDPNLPRSGGPAGNARLTAWTGILLLVVILAEIVTLLDVTGLVRWHVAIGFLLTALVLIKCASVCWRILRYYTGSHSYRRAGPPPLPLRILGPLVMLSTLGVLGSGIALIAIGPQAADRPMMTMFGQSISPTDLHQVLFILFAVFTGLHLLARFVPAALRVTARTSRDGARVSVAGGRVRVAILITAVVASVLAMVLVVPSVNGWQHEHFRDRVGYNRSSR